MREPRPEIPACWHSRRIARHARPLPVLLKVESCRPYFPISPCPYWTSTSHRNGERSALNGFEPSAGVREPPMRLVRAADEPHWFMASGKTLKRSARSGRDAGSNRYTDHRRRHESAILTKGSTSTAGIFNADTPEQTSNACRPPSRHQLRDAWLVSVLTAWRVRQDIQLPRLLRLVSSGQLGA